MATGSVTFGSMSFPALITLFARRLSATTRFGSQASRTYRRASEDLGAVAQRVALPTEVSVHAASGSSAIIAGARRPDAGTGPRRGRSARLGDVVNLAPDEHAIAWLRGAVAPARQMHTFHLSYQPPDRPNGTLLGHVDVSLRTEGRRRRLQAHVFTFDNPNGYDQSPLDPAQWLDHVAARLAPTRTMLGVHDIVVYHHTDDGRTIKKVVTS